MLFHISYGFKYYLQLLCLQFLSETRLIKKNSFLPSKQTQSHEQGLLSHQIHIFCLLSAKLHFSMGMGANSMVI
jgi:hypothetical protein